MSQNQLNKPPISTASAGKAGAKPVAGPSNPIAKLESMVVPNTKQPVYASKNIPNPKDELILLKVQNKHGLPFNDQVRSVTSFNERGVFDILPEHENFISIIKDKIIIHQKDGKDKEMKIGTAVLRVIGKEINIFLGATATTNPTPVVSMPGSAQTATVKPQAAPQATPKT